MTTAVLLFVLTAVAAAQGISTGDAPPAPRPKFSGLPFQAKFVDVARQSGLTAPFVSGGLSKRYIIEANGSGVAFTDFDNDGRLDIFLVNGSRLRPAPKGQAPLSRFYRNAGAGKFADVTGQSGFTRTGWGNGVCGGDFDNDGDEDLFVTYWGPNSLLRNKGGGKFEDIASAAGVAGPASEWSTGCTFVDYDRDGLLDLFVTSYLGFDPKKAAAPGSAPHCFYREHAVFCGPRGLPFGGVTLYRNRGDARFEDASVASGIRASRDFYAFTALATDLNGDGWIDIYVACDSSPSLYFRNNRDGTFTELAAEAGIAYSEHGSEQAGMGVAAGDYDNDGALDITKTNFIRDYPNLYRNLGKGMFEDEAVKSGLGVNPQYVLWGTGLEDFDNDGWRDVFQVGGHVYAEIDAIEPGESYRNPRLLYRNVRGRFEDVSEMAGPGVQARHSSRGAAFGDYDNDGDVDVLIMNMDEPPTLLRNDLKSAAGWLKVKLQGTRSNRSGAGAVVSVHSAGHIQSAPVLSQSSFLSTNDSRLHFGLGRAKVEKIVVRWPSGSAEEFTGAAPGALVLLVEGTGKARPQELPE